MNTSEPNTILLTPRVYADFKRTIALHPPETAAMLGGSLQKPNLITEFQCCPPKRVDGELQSGGAYIQIDGQLMNWFINHCWGPQNLTCLGFIHSHPAGVTGPSGFNGDLGFFQACLEHESSLELGWNRLLAPIVTFNANGRDQLHGWTFKRGAKKAEPAAIYVLDGEAKIPVADWAQHQESLEPNGEIEINGDANIANDLSTWMDEAQRDAQFVESLAAARTTVGTNHNLSWRDRRWLLKRTRQLQGQLFERYLASRASKSALGTHDQDTS